MDEDLFSKLLDQRNRNYDYLSDIFQSFQAQENPEQFDRFHDQSVRQFEQMSQISEVKEEEKNKINIDCIIEAQRNELQEVSSTSQSSSIYHPKNKEQKKGRQYPTKNMLPAIMPLFTQYLESKFDSEQLNTFQEYRNIKAKKNRINLQFFVDLFSVNEFRPTLAIYFQEKRIYRDLLKLRIKYPRKLFYFKRIDIFQQAFLTLKFEKIN